MSTPKLHHYVPQFHLRRFADATGRLWVWDRDSDRTFPAQPANIAAEKKFYYLDEFDRRGHDPLTMEKQFSDLEGDVALITGQWLEWIPQLERGKKIPIPRVNREIVSLYIALQFFRTADTRDIMVAMARAAGDPVPTTEKEMRHLHTMMLWDEGLFQNLADRICRGTWLFGRNDTATPFITSDNPVAFRTGDNSMWLKAGIYAPGTYIVFPLSPEIVMYSYPREGRFKKLGRFDRSVSLVVFTDEMVQSENSGQVFMASRFVISRRNRFDHEREFAKSIGTDLYARGGNTLEKFRGNLNHFWWPRSEGT